MGKQTYRRGKPRGSFMTVEEAAAELGIGRTKAYAMAREWRETGGTAGLPVKDLGDVLRVPVKEFEGRFGPLATSEAPAALADANDPEPAGVHEQPVVRTPQKAKARQPRAKLAVVEPPASAEQPAGDPDAASEAMPPVAVATSGRRRKAAPGAGQLELFAG